MSTDLWATFSEFVNQCKERWPTNTTRQIISRISVGRDGVWQSSVCEMNLDMWEYDICILLISSIQYVPFRYWCMEIWDCATNKCHLSFCIMSRLGMVFSCILKISACPHLQHSATGLRTSGMQTFRVCAKTRSVRHRAFSWKRKVNTQSAK